MRDPFISSRAHFLPFQFTFGKTVSAKFCTHSGIQADLHAFSYSSESPVWKFTGI